VELSWRYCNKTDDIGQCLDIEVVIKYKQAELEKENLFLYFDTNKGNKYFESLKEFIPKPIQNHVATVKMSLKIFSTSTYKNIPSSIIIQFMHESKEIKQIGCALKMNHFTKVLFGGSRVQNLLLFGPTGSGKSAFINTCYSLLSETVISQVALSLGGSQTITNKFKSYRLLSLDRTMKPLEPPTDIRLWDIWGFDNLESFPIFEEFLEGKVPKDTNQNKMGKGILLEAPVEDHTQDCVILFLPIAELDNKTSKIIEKMRKFVTKTAEQVVSCVLVLSKSDLLARSSSDPGKEIEKKINESKSIFGINEIYSLVCYQQETEKSFEIDRSVFAVLHAAVSIGRSHQRNQATKKTELELAINS